MKTLWDKYCDAVWDDRKWRIFEKGTRKLLCADYGAVTDVDCPLDDMEFVKAELKKKRMIKMRETIALNPVNRPKTNQQFMTPRIPYWKTVEYKKFIENGGTDKEYVQLKTSMIG